MPPRKRSDATSAAVEYGPGDGLMLDGHDPVLCVGLDEAGTQVRAGRHHSEPITLASERLRKATDAELVEFDDVYARFLRVALANNELGAQ